MAEPIIDPLFDVHMLNDQGRELATCIAENFTEMLRGLEMTVGPNGAQSREFALVKTKLQEAAFFAKRAMAMQAENQEPTHFLKSDSVDIKGPKMIPVVPGQKDSQ